MVGARAAGMVLGSLPFDVDEAERVAQDYIRAGIRAFVLPGSFLSESEKARMLTANIRRMAAEAGLGPILIAMGGAVHPRFELPYSPLAPSPLCVAASGSSAAARRSGRILGALAFNCGVDLVLGPRLELAGDPKDSLGSLDLFGSDPRLVTELGTAFVRGLAAGGVASCVGRFPGLGSTCHAENREGIPLVDYPLDRLERCEMRPFSRAVRQGVDAVLVGRAFVPALEAVRIPAFRSARVIEGRLRTELGFRRLVIGDDPGEDLDPARSAVLGALAGCDLGFFSNPEAALAAACALERAAGSGELPAPRIEFSNQRIDVFLRRFSQRTLREPRPLSPALIARAAQDREAGFCRLSGSLRLDAAAHNSYKGVIIVVFSPPPHSPQAAETKAAVDKLRAALPGAHIALLRSDPERVDAEALTRTIERAGGYKEAVILTYDAHLRPAQESLARYVEESVPRFIVIAMRNPYDAAFFPKAAGLGAALGFSAAAAETIVRHLSGRAVARGRCPVPVLGIEV